MDIDKEVEKFRGILEALSQSSDQFDWVVYSKGDKDFQLKTMAQVCNKVFPDLTLVAFARDSTNQEIIDGLNTIIKSVMDRVDTEEIDRIRAAVKSEDYSLSLGI